MGRDGKNDDQNNGSAQETLNIAEFVAPKEPRPGMGGAGLLSGNSGEAPEFVPLTCNPMVIGRSSNADLVLSDPAVSDYHARIIRHVFGYTVEDLGSAEGTFLHDRRISHARIVDGDIIRLGSTVLTFVSEKTSPRRVAPATQVMDLVPARSPMVRLPRKHTESRGSYVPGHVNDYGRQIRNPVRSNSPVNQEAEPSLDDLLRKIIRGARFIRRHAVLILVFAAVGLVLGAVSFTLLPPVRSAFCTLTLYPAPKINPVDPQGLPRSQSDEMNFFFGVERAATSNESIMATLQRMGVPNPNEGQAIRIAKRLRLGNMGNNTYIVTMTPKLLDRRGEWHLQFLDAHIKNYLETEVEKKLKVFVSEVDFLRSQTVAAEKRVKEITEETVKYREAHSDQILAQSSLASSPAELESRRIALSGQISRLTGELEGIHSQLSRGSAINQARTQSGQSDREALASLNRKLAELRAQGFADGHPEVEKLLNEQRTLQKTIDDHLRADVTQIERRSNAAYDSLQSQADLLQAQLKAARSELGSIEAGRRSLRTITNESPKVNARLDEFARMKDEAVRQHELLSDRLKKAEVQLQLERVSATSRYEMTPTTLNFPPGRVAFALRTLLGLGVGLLFAALFIAFRELSKMFKRVAQETPVALVLVTLFGAVVMGCAHDGSYVWVEDMPAKNPSAGPVIHPRDTLLIEVQKQPSLSGEFWVREDGHYTQPMAGSIYVADKTPGQVADSVASALRDVVVAPVVSVWISKPSPIKVSVVGEVKTPGAYELTRDRSLLSALALAGWVTEFAQTDRVFVVRAGARERIRFRVKDITTATPRTAQFQLADADVVVVE